MSLLQTIKQLYWTVTEQTVPANPDSGDQRLYIDSADHKLKRVNSSGTVTAIEGAGSAGHVIQEEGTPLTARANLNFVGGAVTATDDSGNDATVITLTAPIASGVGKITVSASEPGSPNTGDLWVDTA